MTRNEYIEMLKAEYRAIHKQIIELEKRQEQIHEMLEEVLDSESFTKWEVKEDESTN